MNSGVCIHCKHYKPDWEYEGYDVWYGIDECTPYYTGKCYWVPQPVIKSDAWKQSCSQFEQHPEYDSTKSYWDQVFLKNPNK